MVTTISMPCIQQFAGVSEWVLLMISYPSGDEVVLSDKSLVVNGQSLLTNHLIYV